MYSLLVGLYTLKETKGGRCDDMKPNKKLEALKRARMKNLARETIKKPIEFIYNGNYTQEEMYYFMEERKRLKGIKKRE